jgi:formate-dependent nitrite reductase membrane component NrfD
MLRIAEINNPNLPIIFLTKATTSNISANEIPNRGFL